MQPSILCQEKLHQLLGPGRLLTVTGGNYLVLDAYIVQNYDIFLRQNGFIFKFPVRFRDKYLQLTLHAQEYKQINYRDSKLRPALYIYIYLYMSAISGPTDVKQTKKKFLNFFLSKIIFFLLKFVFYSTVNAGHSNQLVYTLQKSYVAILPLSMQKYKSIISVCLFVGLFVQMSDNYFFLPGVTLIQQIKLCFSSIKG